MKSERIFWCDFETMENAKESLSRWGFNNIALARTHIPACVNRKHFISSTRHIDARILCPHSCFSLWNLPIGCVFHWNSNDVAISLANSAPFFSSLRVFFFFIRLDSLDSSIASARWLEYLLNDDARPALRFATTTTKNSDNTKCTRTRDARSMQRRCRERGEKNVWPKENIR